MTDNEIIKALEVCSCDTLELALDLINRQKAEIERLSNFVSEERCYEIAREMIPQFVRQARAEAIKEFAERLKNMCDSPHWCVWMSEIEDLEEEMTGEQK